MKVKVKRKLNVWYWYIYLATFVSRPHLKYVVATN